MTLIPFHLNPIPAFQVRRICQLAQQPPAPDIARLMGVSVQQYYPAGVA